jgi:hypothetical protein
VWTPTRGWNSLSARDGSKRTFAERLRSPDRDFPRLLRTIAIVLPLSFGFVAIPLAAAPLVMEATLGPASWMTKGASAIALYLWKLIPAAIFSALVGTYALRGYIFMKLRQQKRRTARGYYNQPAAAAARGRAYRWTGPSGVMLASFCTGGR